MLSIETMKIMKSSGLGAKANGYKKLEAARAAIAKVKAEPGRTAEYVKKSIEDIYRSVEPELLKSSQDSKKSAELVKNQLPRLQSKAFMLSRAKFDDDQTIDSRIKADKLTELNLMPSGLLQMVLDDAVESNNLPLVHVAMLAGNQRDDIKINLDAITIPSQDESLALASEIISSAAAVELNWLESTGREITAEDRLAVLYS